jgi:ketosteroid isomerase-like protein
MRAARMICRLLLPVLLLAGAQAAEAQRRSYTPPAGSAERQALMDALRETVRRELGKPAVFQVRELRVLGDWAFADVSPRTPDGAPFDYRGTPMEEAWREGFVDDGMYAVLRRQDGRWRVVRHAIGPTDVAWIPWQEELRLPRALFPYPDRQ